jgi:hypothetical protein
MRMLTFYLTSKLPMGPLGFEPTLNGEISRTTPSFSVFKPILRASQRPFSYRDHPWGRMKIKIGGYRFCKGLQLTNVTFWDFTRVKLMSCKECSVEEYIATWLRSSRP